MKLLYPFLLVTLILISCQKDLETPPCCTCDVPYSESGLNVLDCYMEGSPWSKCDSNKRIIKSSLSFVHDSGGSGDFWQFGSKKFIDGAEENIFIVFDSPKKGIIPIYKVDGPNSPSGNVFAFFKNSDKYIGTYRTDTSKYNYLEITKFDTINHIISGRFDCTLKKSGSSTDSTTIKITNGIFDFQYK